MPAASSALLLLLRACAVGELRALVRMRFQRHALRNTLVPLTADLEHLADLGGAPEVIADLEETLARLCALGEAAAPVQLEFDPATMRTALVEALGIEVAVFSDAPWAPLAWLAPRWAVVARSARAVRLFERVLELELAEDDGAVELLMDAARAVGAHAESRKGCVRASAPEDPPRTN